MAKNEDGEFAGLTDLFKDDVPEEIRPSRKRRRDPRNDMETSPKKEQQTSPCASPRSVKSKMSSNSSMITKAEATVATEVGNSSRQGTGTGTGTGRNIIHEKKAWRKTLFKWPTTQHIRKAFKNKIESSLWERLAELTKNDFDIEHGFEIVDSVYLLKFFNVSNPDFENFLHIAGDGEKRLREGLKLVKEGFDKLKSAVSSEKASWVKSD